MKRIVLLALGWLCFIVGLIGVVVPVLPTTPLVLLAAFLFARSSTRWEAWIKERKVYKKYVVPYKRNQGFTMRQKVEILGTTSLLLLISGLLVDHLHVRLLLAVIAVSKYIVFLRFIPTIRPEKVME
ncbi:YbaN family protein [Paenibacillus marinisediminis]